MKNGTAFVVAGLFSLFACGVAFAQLPPIPPGAGVGVHRQPPGSRFEHHPRKPSHPHRSATRHNKQVNPRATHRRVSP
jgi:hypothetical protein